MQAFPTLLHSTTINTCALPLSPTCRSCRKPSRESKRPTGSSMKVCRTGYKYLARVWPGWLSWIHQPIQQIGVSPAINGRWILVGVGLTMGILRNPGPILVKKIVILNICCQQTNVWLPIFVWNTLWLFNIAMENGPFIVCLPIKNSDFP